jgi:outer membrane lipoprotein-sorting protein
VGERRAHVVLLTPKSKDAAFVRAKVWIDPSSGALLQFEAVEPNGLTRLVRILTFSPNAAVSARAFTFTVPRGVKVVDIK